MMLWASDATCGVWWAPWVRPRVLAVAGSSRPIA